MKFKIEFNELDLTQIKEAIEYELNDNLGSIAPCRRDNLILIKNTIKKVLVVEE